MACDIDTDGRDARVSATGAFFGRSPWSATDSCAPVQISPARLADGVPAASAGNHPLTVTTDLPADISITPGELDILDAI
jgi:hypothetical protein